MTEAEFVEIAAWIAEAGLAGLGETEIVAGFCDRVVAAGLPLARAAVFIDTLHPVYEGRLFRWDRGNIGSKERLDFTVIGPAVNEVSRIAAMCRSVDQPVLLSAALVAVAGQGRRFVSVRRYALRGVGRPQELFTLDSAT